MKYVLLGSLGNINKSLTEKLIAVNNEITVISSNEDRKDQIIKMGAKAAIGKIEDTNFLTKTFTGADAVFTLIPPIHETSHWQKDIHEIGKKFQKQ